MSYYTQTTRYKKLTSGNKKCLCGRVAVAYFNGGPVCARCKKIELELRDYHAPMSERNDELRSEI